MNEMKLYLHGQDDSVDHDQGKYRVFKRWRGDEPPDLRLEPFDGYVPFDRLGFQGELVAFSLERQEKM